MIKRLISIVVFLTIYLSVTLANEPRNIILLDQGWSYKHFTDAKKDAPLTPVKIPHTWNANYIEGTTSYNRETMVYKRNLNIPLALKDKRLFLYFEGVNSAADIFVNKRTAGQHLGGYTAFSMEITDLVHEGDNELEVWVNNSYRTDILPISGDFNIYGGIHRPCKLIATDKTVFLLLFYASPGVFIHRNKISEQQADITVESILSLKNRKSGLILKSTIFNAEGKKVAGTETIVSEESVKQPVKIPKPILWNGKKNPYLYTVVVELCDNGTTIDKIVQKTGLRYFTVDKEKGFFLNGQYLNLYGFCRHEDVAGKGSALTKEDYDLDMSLVNEIGATALRLAHYPHAETMYDLCDKNGIVVWTEIPLCGPGGYDYTGYLHSVDNNARQVLKELVYQKYNHPSICFWGIFNEILVNDGVKFKEYDDPVPFVKELNALYKELDSSRLTAFATCVDQTKYLDCADLVAWNKYFGWYKDAAPSVSKFFDEVKVSSKGKPIGVSEYGAGASIQHHQWPLAQGDRSDSHFHPEEAQSYCHEGNWSAFVDRPYLWAKFIWVLADYQSSIRREGDKDGINDKGVLTYDRKTKKDVFFFYKANWNPEPMIYISSRRFVKRTNAKTQVKVYSNLNEATLYINGKKIDSRKKDNLNRMIWDDITLSTGDNEIYVKGKSGKNSLFDRCIWHLEN